jgi:hypothetical protein
MPNFVPMRIYPPYHFDIKRNRRGYWVVRDRCGLAGGTFLTRKDALRFALFESGGDSTHAHAYPEAKVDRSDTRADRRGVSWAPRPKMLHRAPGSLVADIP